MAPRSTNKFDSFLNSPKWKLFTFITWIIVSGITLYILYNGFPEKTKALVNKIEATHKYVEKLSCNLEEKIEGGQDVSVGISSKVNDHQVILLSNSKLNLIVGDSVILHNQGSGYDPKITLLVSAIEEPTTPFEYEGKVHMYINKNAVKMLDFDPRVGTKKLKMKKVNNGHE